MDNTLRCSIDRWIDLLRIKASEYEHTARREGKKVSQPDIDCICNEMLAFRDGLMLQHRANQRNEAKGE